MPKANEYSKGNDYVIYSCISQALLNFMLYLYAIKVYTQTMHKSLKIVLQQRLPYVRVLNFIEQGTQSKSGRMQ